MCLPVSCCCFSPSQQQIVTEESNQKNNRADRKAAEALRCIQQRLKKAEHSDEDVELLPSPLLQGEIQQAFQDSRLVLVLSGYDPFQAIQTWTPWPGHLHSFVGGLADASTAQSRLKFPETTPHSLKAPESAPCAKLPLNASTRFSPQAAAAISCFRSWDVNNNDKGVQVDQPHVPVLEFSEEDVHVNPHCVPELLCTFQALEPFSGSQLSKLCCGFQSPEPLSCWQPELSDFVG
ncbi:hypothetical protein CRENBAI_015539 [Crenichthys baileyi]|uniref:Uncharacterized protein n=1 Tax=Crenichthys baileyi TaxID=28760 RepID=A0AAV9SDH8_9TELE